MAHGELAWLFHEPHTGLDDCLRMLWSCFRKRMSVSRGSAYIQGLGKAKVKEEFKKQAKILVESKMDFVILEVINRADRKSQVRLFVQLIFGPPWPMNRVNKNTNIF